MRGIRGLTAEAEFRVDSGRRLTPQAFTAAASPSVLILQGPEGVMDADAGRRDMRIDISVRGLVGPRSDFSRNERAERGLFRDIARQAQAGRKVAQSLWVARNFCRMRTGLRGSAVRLTGCRTARQPHGRG